MYTGHRNKLNNNFNCNFASPKSLKGTFLRETPSFEPSSIKIRGGVSSMGVLIKIVYMKSH